MNSKLLGQIGQVQEQVSRCLQQASFLMTQLSALAAEVSSLGMDVSHAATGRLSRKARAPAPATDGQRFVRRANELGHQVPVEGTHCTHCGRYLVEMVAQKIKCDGGRADAERHVAETVDSGNRRMQAGGQKRVGNIKNELVADAIKEVTELWTPPAAAAAKERASTALTTIQGVLGANDIRYEMFGTDDGVIDIVLPAHAVTPDLQDLCRRLLGEGGWTLSGQPPTTAPAADIRKRPDLFPGLPVRSVPVRNTLLGPAAFDGSTGTRNTQIKMTDPGVPNSKE